MTTLTTCAVTTTIRAPDGNPIQDAVILAELSDSLVYNGIIVPSYEVARTDVNGQATLNLFPNVLVHSPVTHYSIIITTPDKQVQHYACVVPNKTTVTLASIVDHNIPSGTDDDIARMLARLSEIETNVKKDAAAVATSVNSAHQSAISASSSKTNAAHSESEAAASAVEAAHSATAAAQSASSIQGSVAEAKQYADEAAVSLSDTETASQDTEQRLQAVENIQSQVAAMRDDILHASPGHAVAPPIPPSVFVFTAGAGQTKFSGVDSNGKLLAYTPSKVIVSHNGLVLTRQADYTATDGNEIVLTNGANPGDIISVLSFHESSLSLQDYVFTAVSGQTKFSGVDSYGRTLEYTPLSVVVSQNGLILAPQTDYTATDGRNIVLTNGAQTGDLLSILSFKILRTVNIEHFYTATRPSLSAFHSPGGTLVPDIRHRALSLPGGISNSTLIFVPPIPSLVPKVTFLLIGSGGKAETSTSATRGRGGGGGEVAVFTATFTGTLTYTTSAEDSGATPPTSVTSIAGLMDLTGGTSFTQTHITVANGIRGDDPANPGKGGETPSASHVQEVHYFEGGTGGAAKQGVTGPDIGGGGGGSGGEPGADRNNKSTGGHGGVGFGGGGGGGGTTRGHGGVSHLWEYTGRLSGSSNNGDDGGNGGLPGGGGGGGTAPGDGAAGGIMLIPLHWVHI